MVVLTSSVQEQGAGTSAEYEVSYMTYQLVGGDMPSLRTAVMAAHQNAIGTDSYLTVLRFEVEYKREVTTTQSIDYGVSPPAITFNTATTYVATCTFFEKRVAKGQGLKW